MIDEEAIGERYRALAGELDERRRRLWAAAEARSHGYGGLAAVVRATGMAENTVRAGLRELEAGHTLEPGRVRRRGGGRKPLSETDPTLVRDLERLVDPDSRGDPARPLRSLGYSLQANAKVREGASHPDRDEQFRHINRAASEAIEAGRPVISVDTKKKELLGDFKAGGRELRPQGSPLPVRVHDFKDPELGKAIPYGVYDLADDTGWVSVGVEHDTAALAVESIRSWWEPRGRERPPTAPALTTPADGGGSSGTRPRLWKRELQGLADETGLAITVCHFPPGTSKWNKIEHRLFSFITQNWRGKPL